MYIYYSTADKDKVKLIMMGLHKDPIESEQNIARSIIKFKLNDQFAFLDVIAQLFGRYNIPVIIEQERFPEKYPSNQFVVASTNKVIELIRMKETMNQFVEMSFLQYDEISNKYTFTDENSISKMNAKYPRFIKVESDESLVNSLEKANKLNSYIGHKHRVTKKQKISQVTPAVSFFLSENDVMKKINDTSFAKLFHKFIVNDVEEIITAGGGLESSDEFILDLLTLKLMHSQGKHLIEPGKLKETFGEIFQRLYEAGNRANMQFSIYYAFMLDKAQKENLICINSCSPKSAKK